MSSSTITYDNFEKKDSVIIVTSAPYTPPHLSKLSNATNLPPIGDKLPTLSRGNIEEVDKSTTTTKESSTYEDGLCTLQEAAIIEKRDVKKADIAPKPIVPKEKQVLNTHLANYLLYKNVNISSLKGYLKSKNSLLVEEPYFSTILSVCEDFNLNPLIMFAITGQEQSFVPKSNENAYKIANNPFNVFNSWKKYNTSIEDSTSIAARTVVNLSKNRPANIDALTWINRKYSEDGNWSKAVRSIFKQLESNVSYLN
ncbi:hypothetical protein [Clostridium sp.]|uniref:hypothetical protein n=1 Tax=Clostridium sp. TaxID=1506 RepID=UPI0025BDABDD|nr:hypothetical protein [Clostridium sp.]